MKKYLVTAVILILAFGCDDPKKASKENFKSAIEPYLKSRFPTCFFTAQFPIEKKAISMSFSNNPKKLNVLVNTGFVEFKKTGEEEVGGMFTGGKKVVDIGSYHLTSAGKAAYTENAATTTSGDQIGGFCIGVPQITNISQFTEPQKFMGQTVSNVKYQYKVGNLPQWAKSEKLYSYFPVIKQYLDSEKENITDSAMLVLTEEGWVHEKLFKGR